jgi:hypothetical protein
VRRGLFGYDGNRTSRNRVASKISTRALQPFERDEHITRADLTRVAREAGDIGLRRDRVQWRLHKPLWRSIESLEQLSKRHRSVLSRQ